MALVARMKLPSNMASPGIGIGRVAYRCVLIQCNFDVNSDGQKLAFWLKCDCWHWCIFSLHWLLVKWRVTYKLENLTYETLEILDHVDPYENCLRTQNLSWSLRKFCYWVAHCWETSSNLLNKSLKLTECKVPSWQNVMVQSHVITTKCFKW